MKKLSIALATALFASLAITGCLKKSFDNPPDTSDYDPGLPVTATIQQLKAMNGLYDFRTGGDTSVVTGDVTIAGIVTANDRSGNLYKVINIEDSTGGIQLGVDAYSLYATYPVGRKVYVKCGGLTLGYNGGTPVLGMGVDAQMEVQPISGTQVTVHIIKADVGHAVTPKVVTLAQLTATSPDRSLLNRLVRIEDAEFTDSLGIISYAQPNGTTNRDVRDCSNAKRLAVRTSNYADFAAIPLPAGKGALTGLFSIYTSPTTGSISPQLTVRDTGDVQFYGARCGGGTGNPSTTAPLVSIDSIRRLYTGTNIKLGSYRIHGTVISDAPNGNVTSGNLVVQDGARGISVYGLSGSYVLGDSLVVDVTGDSLLSYHNSLEIKIVGGSTITKAASGIPVTPRQATIAAILAAYSDYEYTLVRILNGTVATGGTYAGSKSLADGTGTITLYTATGATFAAQAIPAGAHTWTGIVSQYNSTKQLQIRRSTDVQ